MLYFKKREITTLNVFQNKKFFFLCVVFLVSHTGHVSVVFIPNIKIGGKKTAYHGINNGCYALKATSIIMSKYNDMKEV